MIPDELQPEILLRAYTIGVFPMADEDGCINWFSPDPRAIIDPQHFKIPRSLRQRIKQGAYEIRVDSCFERVMRHCADRPDGTWISEEMIAAYCALHHLGAAHSVETYYGADLAGGLYGVSLGGVFCGESMFTLHTDGSKLSLAWLAEHMVRRGMTLLDIQFMTPHLSRFGAVEITRDDYLRRLQHALTSGTSFTDSTATPGSNGEDFG